MANCYLVNVWCASPCDRSDLLIALIPVTVLFNRSCYLCLHRASRTAPSELLRAELGFNTVSLNSEPRLFTRPGSAGFRGDGRKQHGRQGGQKASRGGEARAGPQREVEAETQMEGRTEGWRSGQEKAFREPKKAVK